VLGWRSLPGRLAAGLYLKGDRMAESDGAQAATVEETGPPADPTANLPSNWLKNRLWVRSDHDFRSRLEQVAARLNTDMSKILRDGAEREIALQLETHPRLAGFEFMPLDKWLEVREERLGIKKQKKAE
jgi:hypothetical protein